MTGEDLPVLGETFVPIGDDTHLRVIVIKDMNTPLLIGADALQQAGSCIDFSSRCVTIMGKRYSFVLKHTTPDAIECTVELPSVKGEILERIVEENRDVFGVPGALGACTLPAVTINTGDATPVRQKAYRAPFGKREVIETEVKKMVDMGIVQPSASPWASPVTSVPKKDGSTRFCVDYRKVN